jgi:hypothetical protein
LSVASAAESKRKPAPSAPITARKPTQRSRVTNGNELLPDVDGRSPTARRYRDLCASIAQDLGGADHLSEAKSQLVRRFAALSVQAEIMEASLVDGRAIDISEYSQLTSTLVRVAARIGINRLARDVTPATLQDYMRARRAEAEQREEAD